jgi:general secretion pathway protein H
MEKRTYAAILDFDKNRLSVFTSRIDGGENDEEPVEDEKASAPRPKVYDLPEGIRVEKGVAGDAEVDSGLFQILFFPNGSSSGGHVILGSDRGRSYRINVDFITGIVEVIN